MAAAVALFPAAALPAVKSDDFPSTWNDGKAELDGYTLAQPRYGGQIRHGRAVLIFVTEDHSVKERVKIEGDSSAIPAKDRFTVMKLNFIRTFQTGIYDYKILTSVFSRLDQNLQPSKISTSVQEWCGHVYHQILVDRRKVNETLHSYFGGEGDQEHSYKAPEGVIYEDTIPILVRELMGPWLEPGATLEAPCAPSLLTLRLEHKPFTWATIKITKSKTLKDMGTVLGEIAVRRWTVVTPYSGTYIYNVESDWPHRIVQWTSDQGEAGVLTGSTRLPYWKLHDEGDEKYLKRLGWPLPSQ